VASEGKVTIAANNDNANAGAFDPANVAGDLALMSTDAQAFITAAGGVGNITFATTHANANTSGAAGVLAMPTTAANVQGVATMVLTSSGGSNSGSSFKEVITFDITGSAANSNNISKSADLATKSLTTFTGGTSGGEANSVDLDDAANNAKFADLNAFRTAAGHTGGTYALTAGSADFTLDSDNVLSLKEGKAAGTYTATVTYTSGSNVFTQQLSITTTAAAVGAASKTASQTSTADTSAATRTSTEVTSGKSSLLINEARSGTIKSVGTGAVLSAAFDTFVTAHANGTFTLEGTDAALFSVDKNTGDVTSKGLVDYENKTSYEITVKYTEGTNIYSEAVSLAVTDDPSDGGTHLTDVDLSTQAGSGQAVLILDKALAQISSSQAKLGAIQNRLQHNIDNLSMASMLTETARGRVVDADFARETSELSKQQILGQAATSMLAQANQSKQSVLALLQ
jgi:flagellin